MSFMEKRYRKYIMKLEAENKKLEKILICYREYYIAAMRARSLGLCKKAIMHALEYEKDIK